MVDGRDNAWRNRAPGPHRNTARQAMDGLWTEVCGHDAQTAHHATTAQPQHTNYWAPRTRKRHQQEHRPQRLTESSDLTQHVKGRKGDRPGPRKGTTTRRNVTQGGHLPQKSTAPKGLEKIFRPVTMELSWKGLGPRAWSFPPRGRGGHLVTPPPGGWGGPLRVLWGLSTGGG